jgi:hypothetical protein
MPESSEHQTEPKQHPPEHPPTKPASKKKAPDWQPLGTVRDSFYEAMKQDNHY